MRSGRFQLQPVPCGSCTSFSTPGLGAPSLPTLITVTRLSPAPLPLAVSLHQPTPHLPRRAPSLPWPAPHLEVLTPGSPERSQREGPRQSPRWRYHPRARFQPWAPGPGAAWAWEPPLALILGPAVKWRPPQALLHPALASCPFLPAARKCISWKLLEIEGWERRNQNREKSPSVELPCPGPSVPAWVPAWTVEPEGRGADPPDPEGLGSARGAWRASEPGRKWTGVKWVGVK